MVSEEERRHLINLLGEIEERQDVPSSYHPSGSCIEQAEANGGDAWHEGRCEGLHKGLQLPVGQGRLFAGLTIRLVV